MHHLMVGKLRRLLKCHTQEAAHRAVGTSGLQRKNHLIPPWRLLKPWALEGLEEKRKSRPQPCELQLPTWQLWFQKIVADISPRQGNILK